MRSESSEGLQRLEYVRTHTQSLSGRSLGGLDRAAALPGQRRRGRSGGSVQEELEEVIEAKAFLEPVLNLSSSLALRRTPCVRRITPKLLYTLSHYGGR